METRANYLLVGGFVLATMAGLIAFGPILMKVFFVDLAQLEELPRVLATFALGIMLLAVSFAYQRFAARIFG